MRERPRRGRRAPCVTSHASDRQPEQCVVVQLGGNRSAERVGRQLPLSVWQDRPMIEWLTFGSTLVLVGVTAWYAVLTRNLAQSARDSAKSAQVAAEYAAQSVAAAVASVNVAFHCSPVYGLEDDESALGVTVHSAGATVFVHGAYLLEAYECTSHRADGESFDSILYEPEGRRLTPETSLPVRLHEGESVSFDPDPAVRLEFGVSVASMKILVLYSLNGEGDGIEREVEWIGEYGRDYEVRPSESAAEPPS